MLKKRLKGKAATLNATLLLIALTWLTLAAPVMALGLNITPYRLDFNQPAGSTATQILNVTNQSDQAAIFHAYIEEVEYQNWFQVNPGEFVLDAGESRDVAIKVALPKDLSGEHACSLCVTSAKPGSSLNIGAGVKVPVNIIVIDDDVFTNWLSRPLLIGGLAATLLVIIGTLFYIRKS